MLDQNLIQTIRTKYQLDMKESVIILSKILDKNYLPKDLNILDNVDKQLELFTNAKERATHFESIIQTLSNEIKTKDD